jgi:hypothetical protein
MDNVVIVALFALSPWVAAAQDRDTARRFVIVAADSIALRPTPAFSALPSHFGLATLQLEVLDSTSDSQWLQVKIGETRSATVWRDSVCSRTSFGPPCG